MSDDKVFGTYLFALAEMVPNFTLKPEMLAMYDEAAAKLGYKKTAIAVKHLIATRSSRDPFPSIAEISALVAFNGLDAEELAAKITGAVSKFGNYRAADARIYLGEIAWEIILVEGGWENVCQMLTYENMSTLQAQWRKLAGIMIQRKKSAELVKVGYLEPLGEIVKQIPMRTPELENV